MNFVKGHWKESLCKKGYCYPRLSVVKWFVYSCRGSIQRHVYETILPSLFHTGEGKGRQEGPKMKKMVSQTLGAKD